MLARRWIAPALACAALGTAYALTACAPASPSGGDMAYQMAVLQAGINATATAGAELAATQNAQYSATQAAIALTQQVYANQAQENLLESQRLEIAALALENAAAQADLDAAIAESQADAIERKNEISRTVELTRLEIERAQRMNTVYAVAPWLILVGLLLIILAGAWRWLMAWINGMNVIRGSSGDVEAVLLEHGPGRAQTLVRPQLLPAAVQAGWAGVMPPAALSLVEQAQWTLLLHQSGLTLPSRPLEIPARPPQLIQPARLAAQGAPVIHPLYQVDPRTLPALPLFEVGSRLMAGGSRSGKTNAAMFDVARMPVDDLAVYDPKYTPGKWPAQAQIITRPAGLVQRLEQAAEAFERRRDTQQAGGQMLTIVDEYTALVVLSKSDIAEAPAMRQAMAMLWSIILYGAEFAVNVWLLTQGSNAATLGLSGRGDMRNSLTQFMFRWRPRTQAELHIPRIAEVINGETVERYYVPEFREPAGTAGTGSAPVPAAVSAPEPVDHADLADLRSLPAAADFSDREIVQVLAGLRQGQSASQIASQLGRRRVDGLRLVSAVQQTLGGV